MIGAICKREVCAHPIITIRCFGWKVFWHVLIAKSDQTFLELVVKYSKLSPPQVNVAKLIGRCIRLEQRANHLYAGLAKRWRHREEISQFMNSLADQELEHVELLEVCRKLASDKHWRDTRFAPCKDVLPKLEQSMNDAERKSERIETEQDALRLVLWIEGSEINRAFSAVVDATDSSFIRLLKVFQQTGRKHIGFICDQVSQMKPELSEECKILWTSYFGPITGAVD